MNTLHQPVLVVDDNPYNLDILGEVLSAGGFLVDTASNGREAVRMAGRKKYSVILMDLIMPVMSGFEAIRQIRAMKIRTPIIAQSSIDAKEDIDRCLELGCDEYIIKPIDFKMLIDTIERYAVLSNGASAEDTTPVPPSHYESEAIVNSNFTILLVEEDIRLAERFTDILVDLGFNVEMSATGTDAWDAIVNGDHACDMVITDMFTPGIDGFGLMSRIKTHGLDIPVIIFTSDFDSRSYQLAIQLGANAIISKSRFNHTITEIIESALYHHRSVQREAAERRQAEKALHEREEIFRRIVYQSIDGIVLMKNDGAVVEWNDGMERITGIPKREAVARPSWEIRHAMLFGDKANPEQIEEIKSYYKAVFESRSIAGISISHDTAVFHAHGGKRYVHESPFFLELDGEQLLCVIIHDITEHRQLEEERIKNSRLDSIGILAGGIAHDFNNILTGILNGIGLVKDELSRESPGLNSLTLAENEVFRAMEITNQLITFSTGGKPVRSTFSLSGLLRDMAIISNPGPGIECVLSLGDDPLIIHGDSNQLSLALSNIILNSAQSMPDGGSIEIGAFPESGAQSEQPSLRRVMITITDHGAGIMPEDLPKVFDPYFTTKKGAHGLGLPIAHSILKNHGGALDIRSTPGTGATVTLFLPSANESVENTPVIPSSPAVTNRVLIMDDERGIRHTASMLLNRQGYPTDTACDGEEAIAMYRKAEEEGQPYRAVIMDLTVPAGMGGAEAVKILRSSHPSAVVIVSSGYSDDPVIAKHREYGFNGVVLKPYKVTDLVNVIKKLTE